MNNIGQKFNSDLICQEIQSEFVACVKAFDGSKFRWQIQSQTYDSSYADFIQMLNKVPSYYLIRSLQNRTSFPLAADWGKVSLNTVEKIKEFINKDIFPPLKKHLTAFVENEKETCCLFECRFLNEQASPDETFWIVFGKKNNDYVVRTFV